VIALLVLVGVAACGDDDDASSDTTEATATAADATTTTGAEGTSAAALTIADSDLGEIVADERGLSLYAFTPDSDTTSACTGGCADAWPPLAGPAEAGDGVDSSLLGTITRDDGSTQATYGGHPLYHYAGDAGPGDTSGQGTGDQWFVIDAEGATVTGSPGSGDDATTTTGDRYGY
jgi:predicted lipoprotein with Yx(FWY)xxD motif